MRKLAIIITHPIQYYAPVFKLLAERCELKVFYTWGKDVMVRKYDPNFGKEVAWDIPLLEGYHYTFLKNISNTPGSHHSKGIINPHIIDEISRYNPDALLVYGWLYNSHRKVLKHFKNKVPIWFRGDSTLLDHRSGLKGLLKKMYLTFLYKNVDKAFYVGSNNKKYFLEYGLKDKQLIWAPHAVDNQRFAENKRLKNFRVHLGIPKSAKIILFAGKLEPKKNPSLLLEAFMSIANERTLEQAVSKYSPETDSRMSAVINKLIPMSAEISEQGRKDNIHLVFVGNGVLEEGLKSKVAKLALENVHFMPFQNQSLMPSVYGMADIFCLPSVGPGETWGLAVNEAMACGKAVLVSNKVGCAVDLIKDGINGYVFESGNMTDLKKKLKILLSSDLVDMGTQSEEIIQSWTFENQVDIIAKSLLNFE